MLVYILSPECRPMAAVNSQLSPVASFTNDQYQSIGSRGMDPTILVALCDMHAVLYHTTLFNYSQASEYQGSGAEFPWREVL